MLVVAEREQLPVRSDGGDLSDLSGLKTVSPEVAANMLLCLVNQTSYLSRRQLERLGQDFVEHGGFTERLYAVRSRQRILSDVSDVSGPSPACLLCAKPMRRRIAWKGPRPGQAFWGCSDSPNCTNTRPLSPSDSPDSSDMSDPSDRLQPRKF